ncbi:pilin [Patescibacteria group bacterium]|nr:pilin [Patescibacteria group bacterium]
MKPKPSSLLIYFLILIGLLFLPLLVKAQILPACSTTGNCGICDFLDTFVNIIRWVLGVVGGLALLLMVWHAFGWLTSAGNEEKIKTSRQGIVHTILGVVIILVAWQLVNIIIVLLVSPQGGNEIKLFGNNGKIWYRYCSEVNECIGRADGSPCGDGYYCENQSCNNTGESACNYWATYKDPAKMGGTNPYAEYRCLTKDQCDPYENLGPAYCPGTEESCCKPK